jgi:hypothetical protein
VLAGWQGRSAMFAHLIWRLARAPMFCSSAELAPSPLAGAPTTFTRLQWLNCLAVTITQRLPVLLCHAFPTDCPSRDSTRVLHRFYAGLVHRAFIMRPASVVAFVNTLPGASASLFLAKRQGGPCCSLYSVVIDCYTHASRAS